MFSLAVKADLEAISDRANRAIILMLERQKAKTNDGNPDLALDVTPAIRQAWQARFDALVTEIKQLAAGLP